MITEQRLRFEAKHKVPAYAEYSEERGQYTVKRLYGEEEPALHSIWDVNIDIYNALWQGYQSALEDRQGEAVADVIAIQPADMTATVKMKPLLNYGVPLSIGDKLFTSPQPAQPDDNNYHDAYRSAMNRAYAAEKEVHELKRINSNLVKALSEECNGQTHMGEPVLPAQPHQAGIPRNVLVEAYMLMEADESQIPDDPKEALEKLIDWHCEFRKAVGSVAQPDQWNAAIEAAADICQAEGDEWDSDDVQTSKNYAHACRDRILALRKGA
jgi:hypothetical protein